MAYTKFHDPWEDHPSVDTPITGEALDHLEEGIDTAHEIADQAVADHAADVATLVAAIAAGDAVDAAALAAHINDAIAAHQATAIAFTPQGTISATTVQAAIMEAVNEFLVSSGIPSTVFDEKGQLISSSAADTVEMVPAPTVDGEALVADSAEPSGMKWAVPDTGAAALVDLTDVTGGPPQTGEAPVWDGDSFEYTNVATQAELDADAALLAAHLADTTDAHMASAIGITDAAGDFTATHVEGALAEIQTDIETLQGLATVTRRYPIQLHTPASSVTAIAGNAFWTAVALTDWDAGHWEFIKDLDGKIYGVVKVPHAIATTGGNITLEISANATSGVTRLQVGHKAIADGESMNPTLTDITAQDITVPGTAYLRKKVTFAITESLSDGDLILVEVYHEGDHANDTLNAVTMLWGAWLETTENT